MYTRLYIEARCFACTFRSDEENKSLVAHVHMYIFLSFKGYRRVYNSNSINALPFFSFESEA